MCCSFWLIPLLNTTGSVLILWMSYFSSEHSQGDWACNISYMTTPKENRSDSQLYLLCSRVSRAMYSGEPILNSYFYFSYDSLMAKPKSPSLATPAFNRIFSDLMSLCTIWCCFMRARAQAMLQLSFTTRGSGSPNLEKVMSLNKSPSSHSQVTTKQKELVSQTSRMPTMKSDLSSVWHLISLASIACCDGFLNTSLSMILMQTSLSCSLWQPMYASLVSPLPSFWSNENSYLPIDLMLSREAVLALQGQNGITLGELVSAGSDFWHFSNILTIITDWQPINTSHGKSKQILCNHCDQREIFQPCSTNTPSCRSSLYMHERMSSVCFFSSSQVLAFIGYMHCSGTAISVGCTCLAFLTILSRVRLELLLMPWQLLSSLLLLWLSRVGSVSSMLLVFLDRLESSLRPTKLMLLSFFFMFLPVPLRLLRKYLFSLSASCLKVWTLQGLGSYLIELTDCKFFIQFCLDLSLSFSCMCSTSSFSQLICPCMRVDCNDLSQLRIQAGMGVYSYSSKLMNLVMGQTRGLGFRTDCILTQFNDFLLILFTC